MTENPDPPTPSPGDRSWRFQQRDEEGPVFEARVRRQKALLLEASLPWLTKGRAVRLLYDQAAALQRKGDMTGRIGLVSRLPGPPFGDFVYVWFEPTGRQRTPRTLFLELEAVEPVETEADDPARAAS